MADLAGAEEAVSAARRACDMSANSALDVPVAKCALAAVYAWHGQPDFAIATPEPLVRQPAGSADPSQPSYGDFCLNPISDELRSDPRVDGLLRQLRQPAGDR